MRAHTYLRPFFLAMITTALVACGGGGGSGSSKATAGNSNSDGNGAPTIKGEPTSAQAGEAYSFTPSAQDPEGAALQFSVQNLPAWASFDASTGRISGTPGTSAAGTYSGISITVSDGVRTSQLGPFSIEVVEMGTGVVTLSWTPPTANTDGSALSNLGGYRVLYGRSTDALTRTIEIDNPSLSTYMVERLATGTWYFAVVAVNGQGTWSALSNIATRTVS